MTFFSYANVFPLYAFLEQIFIHRLSHLWKVWNCNSRHSSPPSVHAKNSEKHFQLRLNRSLTLPQCIAHINGAIVLYVDINLHLYLLPVLYGHSWLRSLKQRHISPVKLVQISGVLNHFSRNLFFPLQCLLSFRKPERVRCFE